MSGKKNFEIFRNPEEGNDAQEGQEWKDFSAAAQERLRLLGRISHPGDGLALQLQSRVGSIFSKLSEERSRLIRSAALSLEISPAMTRWLEQSRWEAERSVKMIEAMLPSASICRVLEASADRCHEAATLAIAAHQNRDAIIGLGSRLGGIANINITVLSDRCRQIESTFPRLAAFERIRVESECSLKSMTWALTGGLPFRFPTTGLNSEVGALLKGITSAAASSPTAYLKNLGIGVPFTITNAISQAFSAQIETTFPRLAAFERAPIESARSLQSITSALIGGLPFRFPTTGLNSEVGALLKDITSAAAFSPTAHLKSLGIGFPFTNPISRSFSVTKGLRIGARDTSLSNVPFPGILNPIQEQPPPTPVQSDDVAPPILRSHGPAISLSVEVREICHDGSCITNVLTFDPGAQPPTVTIDHRVPRCSETAIGSALVECLREGKCPDSLAFFFRRGQYWMVGFQSIVGVVQDVVGCIYVHSLLVRPWEWVHVLEVLRIVPEITAGSLSIGEQCWDEEGFARVQEELQKIKNLLKQSQPVAKRRKLEKKAQDLQLALQKNVGLKGPRVHLADTERFRRRVSRAIGIALKKIEEAHLAAGRHFRACLDLGTQCRYRPDEPWPRWILESAFSPPSNHD